MVVGIAGLISCESDPDGLGSQFLQDQAANGTVQTYDLIAFNNNNHDTLRTDSRLLGLGMLGAFNEPVFGSQSSAYVTQVRLSSYNPNFGVNPVVDSVSLKIVPNYSQSADLITRDTILIKGVKGTPDSLDKKVLITNYPIVKYGNEKINSAVSPLTFRVDEVTDFLQDNQATFYSNQQVATGAFLGQTTNTTGTVSSEQTLSVGNDNTAGTASTPAIKISLDKTYFQNKIIGAQGQSVLNDAASFIRYLRGIRISTANTDGYMFSFNPSQLQLTMYYSNDVTASGKTTRTAQTFSMDVGTSNARFEQYYYNRPAGYTAAMGSINSTTGDPRLYVEGTGGPGATFMIPDATIQAIKNLYQNQKVAIVSASIRLYTDQTAWNNSYTNPTTFTITQKGVDTFIPDITQFLSTGIYQRVLMKQPDKNSNAVYYDLGITQTLKDIVEQGAQNLPIQINVGDFIVNPAAAQSGVTSYLSPFRTTRAYTPNRIVLVGTNSANPAQSAQLRIIYTTQK